MRDTPLYSEPSIAIAGASSFIGLELIKDCVRIKRSVSGLSTSDSILGFSKGEYEHFQADLLRTDSLHGWPSANQTVVNLAYIWSGSEEENLQATTNLLSACSAVGIKRFIHVSTAAVVGRTDVSWVDECTRCHPFTTYGRTKLRIEDMIRRHAQDCDFDVVILRPTSVFGKNGTSLSKLCDDLQNDRYVKNYLRLCLFGQRAMNLVSIENVIAAIQFAVEYERDFSCDTFIVSDDEEPLNNYANVEELMRTGLGLSSHLISPVLLPRFILETFLRLRRRNIVNTRCRFSAKRLRDIGFLSRICLKDALISYADWYRNHHNNFVADQGTQIRRVRP